MSADEQGDAGNESRFEVNTTYEPFSEQPEYIAANREFIGTMDLDRSRHLLDLACGTGVMTELVRELRPEIDVVGLDLSLESLQLAQARFANDRNPPGLILGTADILPLPDGCVDTVIMGNSIHMLPDRNRLLQELRRVLKPRGLFGFNGSFYAGTMVEGTERFYQEWVKRALLHIVEEDRRRRERGDPGIRRRRGTVGRAFSAAWPSPDEWAESLAQNGFELQSTNERPVVMGQSSLETIGAYAGLAEVLLSGYPVKEASIALQTAVGSALRAENRQTVSRKWLEVVALRT